MIQKQFQNMSFPKINEFLGKVSDRVQYKKLSLIHSLKNSLARNKIPPSMSFHSPSKIILSGPDQNEHSMSTNFKYEQKIPTSFQFDTNDIHKLLQHLFNKKQHDIHDRNFIRRLILKYFPQDLISACGKDFINCIRFKILRKNQSLKFNSNKQQNQQEPIDQHSHNGTFYMVLRGKVTVKTRYNQSRKSTGEYFGQIQILGEQNIISVKAKTDSMLITMKQQHFNQHFYRYFQLRYWELQRKVNLVAPLLNLTSKYKQLLILNSLQERQYITGQKVIQKGQLIKQIVFLNNTQISFSHDKILNQYKTIGLNEVVFMQNPSAKQTVYCMQNKTAYAIKVKVFQKYVSKCAIFNYFTNRFLIAATLSAIKVKGVSGDKTTCSYNENNCKLQNFLRVKKVKFIGNTRRVLTQPNTSTPLQSGTNSRSLLNYPGIKNSFVFIKQNSASFSIQKKHDPFRKVADKISKHKQLRTYLANKKDSFQKKRWLDQMDDKNSDSLIYNPEKIDRMYEVYNNIVLTGDQQV